MKAVVDTNVLVSGIFWGGLPREVLDLWMQERYSFLVSPQIISEYSTVLSRFTLPQKQTLASRWLTLITARALFVNPTRRFPLCRDPHDDMFIECAIEGSADVIVSGDNDLLSLGTVLGIPIVKPAGLVGMLDELPSP